MGFFRGWFTLNTSKVPFSEKRDIHFQVDPDKLRKDVNAVEGKTKALLRPESEVQVDR